MNFHDLKLPKELSKKKKLPLYKCWFIDSTSSENPPQLELNWGKDKYGLSEKAAVCLALNENKEFADEIIKRFTNGNLVVVIIKFTLLSGEMDNEVVIAPENSENFDTDPHYDAEMETLYATIRSRVDELDIKNYYITVLDAHVDPNTDIIKIDNLELSEKILNLGNQ